MRHPSPIAAVRSVAVSTFSNQLVQRILLSILLTGFDGSVLISTGQSALSVASEAPWITVAFLLTSVLILATLARIWLLILSKPRRDTAIQPDPESLKEGESRAT
jgi:hypothetical protein